MLLYMTSFRLSRTFSKFSTFSGPSLYSATFILYHTLERLSRSFSTLFIRSVAAYQRQLLDCNTPSCACQQFFEFLQVSVGRAAHLADSLVRIPDPSPFVNLFFQISRKNSWPYRFLLHGQLFLYSIVSLAYISSKVCTISCAGGSVARLTVTMAMQDTTKAGSNS